MSALLIGPYNQPPQAAANESRGYKTRGRAMTDEQLAAPHSSVDSEPDHKPALRLP